MSEVDPSATALAAQGRFQEALAKLSRSRQSASSSMTVAERIEFAELLERTGQLPEAKGHLLALRKLSRLPDAERARCLLVEGLLSKQMGTSSSPFAHFSKHANWRNDRNRKSCSVGANSVSRECRPTSMVASSMRPTLPTCAATSKGPQFHQFLSHIRHFSRSTMQNGVSWTYQGTIAIWRSPYFPPIPISGFVVSLIFTYPASAILKATTSIPSQPRVAPLTLQSFPVIC